VQRNSLHVFDIFGIPIRIHSSWLIIFVLITWSLAASYFPSQYKGWTPGTYWIIGVVTSLLFFLSVLLHELAHSVVARLRGMKGA
jgi:Zn-dependent protease